MSHQNPITKSSVPTHSFCLEQAFKQFSLETERLEMMYRNLQDRFSAVHLTLQESRTRLAGKLAELDFLSRYLESILHHISQGIIFVDLNGIVTTYNAAAQNILLIPQNQILFRPISDFFADSFFGFSLQEALVTKKCLPNSFVSWNQNGQSIELEIDATFVSMSQGSYPLGYRQASSDSVQGLLILLRDITKLRRLQQIANRHDRLKELGELAAHLAHQIRNPLGGIKGFAHLLQAELQERPDLQQMASYIVQGSDDLNQFVSQVLTYARPFHVSLEKIDVVKFLEDMRQLMHADSSWSREITLIFQSRVTSLIAPIDPQLLKSALLNLLVNAIQAMPNGGDLIITLDKENSYFILSIEDTGVGIAPEILPKLFSPFFTTKQAGNGLGLAQVQKIIQAHQGWIEVVSELNRGSIFTIKIPLI